MALYGRAAAEFPGTAATAEDLLRELFAPAAPCGFVFGMLSFVDGCFFSSSSADGPEGFGPRAADDEGGRGGCKVPKELARSFYDGI